MKYKIFAKTKLYFQAQIILCCHINKYKYCKMIYDYINNQIKNTGKSSDSDKSPNIIKI